jgi:hypothetical protein
MVGFTTTTTRGKITSLNERSLPFPGLVTMVGKTISVELGNREKKKTHYRVEATCLQ